MGDNAPWIEGKDVIKKATLTFSAKSWWLLVRYRLCPTVTENLLTLDGAVVIASIMDGYNINFAENIRHELHKRAFGETTTLPFLCLVQRLCDKTSLPEVPAVVKRVEATTVAQIKMMKEPTHPNLPR
ncbi:hypothetical protein FXO38_35686 [Capsicum annuum]|nr:hypothetical protein FXO38_35686 [Capsicum annuum]